MGPHKVVVGLQLRDLGSLEFVVKPKEDVGEGQQAGVLGIVPCPRKGVV